MKLTLLIASVIALFYTGCSSKNVTVNGLICPSNHTEQMVQNDLQECHYYDLKAIEESATPKIEGECKKCLEAKGYRLE